ELVEGAKPISGGRRLVDTLAACHAAPARLPASSVPSAKGRDGGGRLRRPGYPRRPSVPRRTFREARPPHSQQRRGVDNQTSPCFLPTSLYQARTRCSSVRPGRCSVYAIASLSCCLLGDHPS